LYFEYIGYFTRATERFLKKWANPPKNQEGYFGLLRAWLIAFLILCFLIWGLDFKITDLGGKTIIKR
jgi:hypothetical protein